MIDLHAIEERMSGSHVDPDYPDHPSKPVTSDTKARVLWVALVLGWRGQPEVTRSLGGSVRLEWDDGLTVDVDPDGEVFVCTEDPEAVSLWVLPPTPPRWLR